MERFCIIMLFSVSFIVATNCGQRSLPSSVEALIAKRLTERCQKNLECQVNLEGLTEFEWDKLVVFDYGAERDLIERVLGQNFPIPNEIMRKLVFLNKGEVVHSEFHKSNVDRRVSGEVWFAETDRKNYAVYSNKALFSVQIFDRNYELRCINCPE